MSSTKPVVPDWPSLYDPFVDLLNIAHRDPIQPGGHYLYDADDIFRFTLYWTFIFYLPIFVLSGVLASANIAFAPNPKHQSSPSRYADEDVLGHQDEHEAYPLAPLNKPSGPAAGSPTSPGFPKSSAEPTSPSPPSPTGTAFGAKQTRVSTSTGPDCDLSAESGPNHNIATGVPPARVSTSTSTAPATPAHTSHPKKKPQAQIINPHRTRVAYSLLVLLTYLTAGLLGAVAGSIVVGYVLAGLYKSGGFFMSTWIPPIFALVQTLIGVLGIYPSVAEII